MERDALAQQIKCNHPRLTSPHAGKCLMLDLAAGWLILLASVIPLLTNEFAHSMYGAIQSDLGGKVRHPRYNNEHKIRLSMYLSSVDVIVRAFSEWCFRYYANAFCR